MSHATCSFNNSLRKPIDKLLYRCGDINFFPRAIIAELVLYVSFLEHLHLGKSTCEVEQEYVQLLRRVKYWKREIHTHLKLLAKRNGGMVKITTMQSSKIEVSFFFNCYRPSRFCLWNFFIFESKMNVWLLKNLWVQSITIFCCW